MKLPVLILWLSGMTSFIGCSHMHKVDGVQAQDNIPAGIRVRLGSAEVNNGEVVDILIPVCSMSLGAGKRSMPIKKCVNEKVGNARVLKVLDHDSAVIEPLGGLQMSSEMIVEKQK